jgi:vesicle coat complex subunit
MRAPMLFSSDYKSFYCQFSDPSYVKKLKLEMLTAIANESNTYEIVTELCEYAGNVDVPIARESIRAVGKIALQQYDVNAIVDRLLQFLEMDKEYVTAETLVLVKDLLRKYPQWSHDCIAVVGNISSKNIQEPKGKAALIWMLGEYSQDMHDAPYILESLVENWEEEHSPEVVVMFFSSPLCFLSCYPTEITLS